MSRFRERTPTKGSRSKYFAVKPKLQRNEGVITSERERDVDEARKSLGFVLRLKTQHKLTLSRTLLKLKLFLKLFSNSNSFQTQTQGVLLVYTAGFPEWANTPTWSA